MSFVCEDSLADVMGEVSVAIRRRATETNKGTNTRGERRMATVPLSGERSNIVELYMIVGLWVWPRRFIPFSGAQHHSTSAPFRIVP